MKKTLLALTALLTIISGAHAAYATQPASQPAADATTPAADDSATKDESSAVKAPEQNDAVDANSSDKKENSEDSGDSK